MSEISYLNKREIKPNFVVKLIFQCLKLIVLMSGIHFNIFHNFVVKLIFANENNMSYEMCGIDF